MKLLLIVAAVILVMAGGTYLFRKKVKRLWCLLCHPSFYVLDGGPHSDDYTRYCQKCDNDLMIFYEYQEQLTQYGRKVK